MLHIGILGPPGCGKTSIFKALVPAVVDETGGAISREIHLGQVKVPDPRLDELHAIFQRGKQVNAIVEYVDLAGFSRSDVSRGGYDAQFLGQIRSCDALLHVVRNFELPGLPKPDPLRDYQADFQEFLLSDQMIFEGKLQRLRKEAQKRKDPELGREINLMERCLEALQNEQPLRELEFTPEEDKLLRSYQSLSAKPELVLLNIAEDDIRGSDEMINELKPAIESPKVSLTVICASIEMEIAQLDRESAREFMDDLGIKESALNRLIQASYKLLGLISFFTVGDDEVRAWTVKQGTKARQAAGEIHSDLEHGFIRADVVNFKEFQPRGSLSACRKDGVRRLEGKEYTVQDGDIIEFRFAL
ncbi:redox-regulated ATPase YchF [candidate division LCP-89 bacterium B3_LCP]|uniref:Redox-regulated ATPase YchF n=1 Tax=candidate division LCP-89 bacterium B3_LCP TaxID=2012998 RepID=A0A532V0T6_UNCL8|nr:MAG: redox-regulated ATPase YchF [candidate division LCP-89 bacterium B3_LCP]